MHFMLNFLLMFAVWNNEFDMMMFREGRILCCQNMVAGIRPQQLTG